MIQKVVVVEPEIAIEVADTLAPTAAILSPTADGAYYSDQLVLFQGQISDPEQAAEELEFSWESNVDGQLPTASPDSNGLIEQYLLS